MVSLAENMLLNCFVSVLLNEKEVSMRIMILFFLNLLGSFYGLSQCINAPLDSITCLYHFDDDNASSHGNLTFNDIWGYVDGAGQEYAILGGFDSIYVFDVTDPVNSFRSATDDPPGTSIWRDFKTFDHYLYAVADQGTTGLRVYDLDSLEVDKLHLVTEKTDDFVRAHNIFIDENHAKLYVAGSNVGAAREGLLIYDLSSDALARDPALISIFAFDTLIGDESLNFYIHDLFVRDDTAYCSHGTQGYFIWDLSKAATPDSVKLVGFMENSTSTSGGYVHSSWNTDDNTYAYVATELNQGDNLLRQIYIVDQTDKSNPQVVNNWKDPLLSGCGIIDNVPHNPFVAGDLLFISYYEDGLQVLDISDPANPGRIGYFDTEPSNTSYNGTTANWGVYPFLPSGTILVSDTKNGLFVLKLGCQNDLVVSNDLIISDKVMAAKNSVSIDNTSLENESVLSIHAPIISLQGGTEIKVGSQLTLINENLCGN